MNNYRVLHWYHTFSNSFFAVTDCTFSPISCKMMINRILSCCPSQTFFPADALYCVCRDCRHSQCACAASHEATTWNVFVNHHYFNCFRALNLAGKKHIQHSPHPSLKVSLWRSETFQNPEIPDFQGWTKCWSIAQFPYDLFTVAGGYPP